jgi:hypothetical protein
MNFNIQNFIKGFIKRSVTRLFLSFIYSLEDLVSENKISQEEFQKLRKRILDKGNNCIRDIYLELDNFDFLFKNDIINDKKYE